MIEGIIKGQELRIITPTIVSDTINYLTARFRFSDDWNGAEKWAHFEQGSSNFEVKLENDEITADKGLNLTHGKWAVYVHGNRFAGGQVTERITTEVKEICVKKTGITDGDPFPDVEASEVERINAELEAVKAGKMEYYILTFDGTAFRHDGAVLTFAQIREKCLDTKNFVYAQYENRLYIPAYVSGSNVFFDSAFIQSDVCKMNRISISSSNTVTRVDKVLATNEVYTQIAAVQETVATMRSEVDVLKQDLIEVQKNTVYGEFQKKTVNNETVIMLTEKNVRSVKTDFTEQEVTIKGRNRFNLEDAVFTMSGYASSNTVTKEENGIKIVSTTTSTTSSVYAKAQYTAEYDGIIYFSCDAFTYGDVRDIKTLLRKGGSTLETEYGIGRHVYCISVSAGDVIEFGFQSHNQTNKGNTVYYHNIMVSYGGLYDFVSYTADVKNKNTEQSYETIDLPTTQATYTNKSRNPAVGGYYQQINITIPSDSPSIPSVSTDIADIDSNLPVVPYSTLYNGTNGVGISAAGTLAIGIDGKSRTDIIAYLTDNPSWIKYKLAGGQEVIVNITHDFRSGEIVEFTTAQELSYYYTPEKKKRKGICFGDSITGMFGYGADYPSIITRETDCNMVNAGFAGCRWTDHLTSGGNVDKYTPFCMNRLVDAIVSGDYSEQDASGKVNPSDSDFSQLYVDHLENIKSFDFKSADVCTIYYGVNDWNSSVILKSADDPSTENKQRSNVEDAVKYCIDKLLTAYPNMRIVVITPYWWGSTGEHGDSNVDPNSRNDYLRNYGAYIREIAENTFNVPTVDLYSTGANVYNARYFTRDLGHPTVMMKNIIARKIIEKIK